MSAYFITSKETSNIISLICRAQRCRKESKLNNIEGVKQYGEYLGVMECDIKLICDAIKETKKADLFNVLEEMIIWYRKMDRISQGKN